jgi:hypothetical protein
MVRLSALVLIASAAEVSPFAAAAVAVVAKGGLRRRPAASSNVDLSNPIGRWKMECREVIDKYVVTDRALLHACMHAGPQG